MNPHLLGFLVVVRERLSSRTFFLSSDGETNAVDAANRPVPVLSPSAVRRTLTGTLFTLVEISAHTGWAAAYSEALALLSEVVGYNILAWEPFRSREEVVSAIDRAIARLAIEIRSPQLVRETCLRLQGRCQEIGPGDEHNRIRDVLERSRRVLVPTEQSEAAEPMRATAELEGAL